jgi:hypothetical protein
VRQDSPASIVDVEQRAATNTAWQDASGILGLLQILHLNFE